MQVNKRNGSKESVSFDKITKRISDLCFNLEYIDPISVAKDTINALYDGITTRELDILSADICATKAHHYPDYNKLGGRILSSNITKETLNEYKDVVDILNNKGLLSDSFFDFTTKNIEAINTFFDYSRDLLFDYFAIKTLERSYLLRIDGKIVERPQHMLMRVSIGIHKDDLESAIETYELMSKKYMTHATPTLFNAGTPSHR